MAESQNIEWKRSWHDKYLEMEQLLGFHSSYPSNPLIADACFKAGYIDSWGRGIEKVTEACRAAGLPKPHFEESQSGMQVTLFAKARPESGPESGLESKSESKHAESGLGSDTKKSTSEGAGAESGVESGVESKNEGGSWISEGGNAGSEGARLESRLESRLAARVLLILKDNSTGKADLARGIGHKTISGELNKQVKRLLEAGLIEPTIPDKPTSRLQKYRLTEKGRQVIEKL